jgi:hypothetical protein
MICKQRSVTGAATVLMLGRFTTRNFTEVLRALPRFPCQRC